MYISGGWYNDTLQSTGPIKARNFPENEKKIAKFKTDTGELHQRNKSTLTSYLGY